MPLSLFSLPQPDDVVPLALRLYEATGREIRLVATAVGPGNQVVPFFELGLPSPHFVLRRSCRFLLYTGARKGA